MNHSANAAAELGRLFAAQRLPARVAGGLALLLVAIGLTACSQRAGDFGRQRTDYITKNVFDPIDRHLLAGGRMDLSSLPLTEAERRMYDVIWRFYSAPHAREWSPFGTQRVSPVRLASGEAFQKTDGYYAWLRRSDFQSMPARYGAVAGHVAADLQTLGTAFEAICAVQKLDTRRKTASVALPELGEEEHKEVAMRLEENARVIANFALALDYRYEAYSYALKRLLVESPDEAARTVDTNLSALAAKVQAAEDGAYCTFAGGGMMLSGHTLFG